MSLSRQTFSSSFLREGGGEKNNKNIFMRIGLTEGGMKEKEEQRKAQFPLWASIIAG